MPKYHPNTRFTDCWASVGNITFYHRDGQCYFRTKAKPVFPGTSHQQVQLSIHKRALQAWRNISHEEQLEWNSLATQVRSKRPPYGTKSSISGYNLFVSAYHGFACIGDEKVPEPKPMPNFPTLSLKLISTTIVGKSLQVKFKITKAANLQNFTIASRIQLVNLGAGTNPGKMRNHQAELTDSIATFTIPLPNQDHKSYTLHMRYFIIDRTTGYRSMQTRQSEDIKLYNF